jgi:hypothetical protein
MNSQTKDAALWSALLVGQVALWLGLMRAAWAGLSLKADPDLFVPYWFGYCLAGAVLVPAAVFFVQQRIDKGLTHPRALVVAVWVLALCLFIAASVLGTRTAFWRRSSEEVPGSPREHPVWSPEGNALAVNIEGRWKKVDLESLGLDPGTWHERPIGVAKHSLPTSIEESTVTKWEKSGDHGDRKVVMKDGTTVELRQNELSTEFVVTRRGAPAEILWQSGLENCHSLAVSPDGGAVASICELTGVVVTALKSSTTH